MPVLVPEISPANSSDLTMINDTCATNDHGSNNGQDSNDDSINFTVKTGLAKMLKGGVIMDVVNADQVRIDISQCFQAIRY